ncbi:hypothetical protein EJ02DRAFT_252115 [Clathrospora elynae]|uniref:Secreted protein n=1 Tax=Clathrospora elynae TaxID=706981 RepID=A0A6A5SMB8_9PLEO|nr:hypothetical protein EJ02DRAFT_252115 [Clathrospora elynae]
MSNRRPALLYFRTCLSCVVVVHQALQTTECWLADRVRRMVCDECRSLKVGIPAAAVTVHRALTRNSARTYRRLL